MDRSGQRGNARAKKKKKKKGGGGGGGSWVRKNVDVGTARAGNYLNVQIVVRFSILQAFCIPSSN